MNTIEQRVLEVIPEIFGIRSCLPAHDFWKMMEEKLGKENIGCDVYMKVVELYKNKILDTRDGCYYLLRKEIHCDERRSL